jgi:hypothetical protein
MKRRVLVAQALVHRPPVIVLDEPTAGVDVELRQTLWKFVRGLNRDGHTIVLTTHYLEEAQELCGRIAMLKAGRVVALERTADLLEALDRVRAEGVRFELRLLESLPHAVVVEELAAADVVLDQMSLYPAILAHEGMASGCAVLTGNTEFALPVPHGKPVVHITPDTVHRELRRVLTNRELRLDLKQYDRDLVTCQAGLVRDKKLLETLGQRGVPGFWINGRYLSGAQPIENFRTLIDDELAKARVDQAQGGNLSDYYERLMKAAATAP